MKSIMSIRSIHRPPGRLRWFRLTAIGLLALFLASEFISVDPLRVRAAQPAVPPAGTLLINEFRLRGPSGAFDEFIEIFNPLNFDHTVSASAGTGYAVVASDGSVRCLIPNGTVIYNRGHFLCANTNGGGGYSLSAYPAGNGTTATPDATYTLDIPDNAGIALFNTNLFAGFTMANRFDAVGSVAETNSLYRSGTGYPTLTSSTANYSFFRRYDLGSGFPIDTGNNAADFLFADTVGISIGAGQRLGAPGPQNLNGSFYQGPTSLPAFLLDSSKAASLGPNRVRDFTPDPANNAPFGTLSIRRRIKNNTGANMSAIRYRIIDISTFPAPAGMADLRPRTSSSVVAAGINDPGTCTAFPPPCSVTVQGSTLETPPAQPNGGGYNSTLRDGTVTLGTPLPNGASTQIQFVFGVKGNGAYHIAFELEGSPGGGSLFQVSGNTLIDNSSSDARNQVADFDGDGRADLGIFRPVNGQWWINRSSDSGTFAATFGSGTDRITPGDLTGDGKTDIALFRPSTGQWFVLRSEDSSFYAFPFGTNGDVPAPADYDADGKTDAAVFRPSNSTWFISNSGGGTTIQTFGQVGDVPVAADYDGDAKADIAIYRPSLGQWWIQRSTLGAVAYQFGAPTDKTVAADYTGDGKADVGFWRPSTGEWFILRSEDNSYYSFPFGASTDLPAPGDYDDDGKADAGVFRPSNSTWFINKSGGGTIIQQFGQTGDLPVSNAFVR